MDSSLELSYRQVTCQRAVADANFPLGVQDYNWSIGPPLGWIPNKSYFRIALQLLRRGGGGGPVVGVDDLALADNVCAALFNNIYVRMGGQDVSSITNYVPQASQCKTRLDKSGAWLSNIGKSAFGCDADFASRQARTGSQSILLGAVGTTIAIKAVDGRVTGAAGSLLSTGNSALNVDDKIVVNGITYTVTVPAGDDVGAACVVNPFPPADVAATTLAVKIFGESEVGEGTNNLYLTWQPPVGIWDEAKPMGSGDYRVQLNPNAYYRTAAVEALNSLTAGTEYDLVVKDVQLYIATVSTQIPPSGTDTLHLMEMQVQSKQMASGGNSSILDFTLPPSTKAISVFVQAGDAGNNTLVPSTLFKTADASDLGLKNIQITYANQNKPSTRWTSEYKAENTNYMVQRYSDTQLYSGKMFDSGGAEPIEDWFRRGPLMHFSWVRDQADRSTHAQVSIQYDNLAADTNLFVVSHYTRVVSITSENGFITDVQSLSA